MYSFCFMYRFSASSALVLLSFIYIIFNIQFSPEVVVITLLTVKVRRCLKKTLEVTHCLDILYLLPGSEANCVFSRHNT